MQVRGRRDLRQRHARAVRAQVGGGDEEERRKTGGEHGDLNVKYFEVHLLMRSYYTCRFFLNAVSRGIRASDRDCLAWQLW